MHTIQRCSPTETMLVLYLYFAEFVIQKKISLQELTQEAEI